MENANFHLLGVEYSETRSTAENVKRRLNAQKVLDITNDNLRSANLNRPPHLV